MWNYFYTTNYYLHALCVCILFFGGSANLNPVVEVTWLLLFLVQVTGAQPEQGHEFCGDPSLHESRALQTFTLQPQGK